MEDSEKQQIKKHFDNIYQIHLSKMGHVEVFHGDEDLPSDPDYKLFAIYLINGKVILF
jgi:hypothetical protein